MKCENLRKDERQSAVCQQGESVVTSAQIMRFHMARFERRGYGSFRSPERIRFYCVQVLRSMVAALCVFLFVASAAAQDEDVHIQPRENTDPKKQPDTNKVADNTPTPEGGFKVRGKPIQKNVDLVLVNVTVTDDWNRIVTGLDKENFTIMEGNQAQEVKHFASEDAPISLGVIFDMSGSMSDKITRAR